MSLIPQPAHVPLGTLADGSPVYITRPWLRYLAVEIFATLGSGGASDLTTIEALLDGVIATQEMESARYRPYADDLRKRVEALEALLMER
jgi:hypothetical protein